MLQQVEFTEEPDLGPNEFIRLAGRVWPGEYSPELTRGALSRTINLTARVNGELVGCVRILTDGYFFGTVPEVMVDPDYQRQGIGRQLMERAWDRSPTGLFFGAQPENEPFFERLGYERSLPSFGRRKPRRAE